MTYKPQNLLERNPYNLLKRRRFAKECRRQALLLANDPHEKEILDWMEKVAPKYNLDDLLDQCKPEDFAQDDEDKAWINDKPVGREEI